MKRLLIAVLLFIHTEISFAKEKLNYTVTSDSQIQNVKGNFEAIGNVVIKSINNNFEASSNKLTYDKDAKTLKLIGNVFVKNLESEGLSIQESYGDELTIFTDSGLFKFNSENKNSLLTYLHFLLFKILKVQTLIK
jgi:lipopolysaccharide export system protein LptA